MPRKKDGMLFEVHPTPAKGKDGKNIVYVRPAMHYKLTMQGLEDFCNRNYHSPYGEMMRAFDYFLRAAGELMAMGYRVETPIGSFALKLKIMGEHTDPMRVTSRDICFSSSNTVPASGSSSCCFAERSSFPSFRSCLLLPCRDTLAGSPTPRSCRRTACAFCARHCLREDIPSRRACCTARRRI